MIRSSIIGAMAAAALAPQTMEIHNRRGGFPYNLAILQGAWGC